MIEGGGNEAMAGLSFSDHHAARQLALMGAADARADVVRGEAAPHIQADARAHVVRGKARTDEREGALSPSGDPYLDEMAINVFDSVK
jgi:hypothetical protein